MPECLACLGVGHLDFRWDNAHLSEHLPEEEMRAVRQTSAWKQPVQECDECEGTGVISEERHAELTNIAEAAVATFIRTYAKGAK